MDKPKDVVDQHQDVLMRIVPEILGDGHGRVADPKAHAGAFVHLAENHHGAIQDAGGLHLPIELLRLPAALANPAEQADALIGFRPCCGSSR